MAKHGTEPIIKNGQLIGTQRIERKEVLKRKIKKAGNWNKSMEKLTTKELTSFCGNKNK